MWFPTLILCLLPIVLGNTVYQRSEVEQKAERILQNAHQKMEAHWLYLKDIFFERGVSRVSDRSALLKDAFNRYRTFRLNLARELSVLLSEYDNIHSENIKREVKFLTHLKIFGLENGDYNRAQELLEIMRNFTTTENVCLNKACNEYIAHLPGINEMMVNKTDANLLLGYWSQWRKVVSKEAKQAFLEYVQLYRKAAWLNGHQTASRTWYLDFEEHNFLNELETAINELMPLYKELHAYMRYVYNQYYGSDLVPEDGPIPDHLMEHILAHAWKGRDSVIIPPYPRHPLPINVNKFKEWRVDEPLDRAQGFYSSLGLRTMNKTVWVTHARLKPESHSKDCRIEVVSFPPEIGIKYCANITYRSFLQAHQKMAEVVYSLYRNTLPYGLQREAFTGFSNAIGESVILSAATFQHLTKIELMSFDNSGDWKAEFNRLYRMGIHTLFSLMRYFVMEKFWVNALDHNEDAYPGSLNCAYWNLQMKFAGVQPADQKRRGEDYFDLPYTFYQGIDDESPSMLTRKVISELLGYQIYKALCLKSGQYKPSDPDYPLHKCDYYEKKDAGQLLNEAMTLGSQKNWRDIIEIVTGERRISADGMLEYYQPLYDWLKDQNSKNEVEVGWDNEQNSC